MGVRVKGVVLIMWLLVGFSAHSNEVEVVTPVLSEQPQSIVLTGTIEGVQQANIASQQAGLIASIAVEAGDSVEKGQILLTLDDTLAKLNVTQAKAGLNAAKVVLAESERLYQEVLALSKQKVVAQTLIARRNADVATAKAALNEQQARIAVAQEQLNRHKVYAPFAGAVAKRLVNVGEWVGQSSGLFMLLDSHLRLRVAVPQQYFAQLNSEFASPNSNLNNTSAIVSLDATSAKNSITAKVSRVVKAIDTQSRTFTVFIDLPKSALTVAGMSATATIALGQADKQVVWLPASAIKQHPDGGASVFTVKNKQAQRVLVAVISESDGQVAVSGIGDDLPVVASGVELLQSGSAVNVTANSKPSAKP